MYTQFKYSGSTPGADANAYTLFTTVSEGLPARFFALSCLRRFHLSLQNSQAGTLVAQKSENRGVTWTTISSDAVVAAAANLDSVYDYWVEPYADWRLVWTNGGVAQATWIVSMSASDERGPIV